MNNWHTEFMAEYDRQHILKEAQAIRNETLAQRSRAYRPGLFERTMFSFANWMIRAGGQLRKRYEAPVTHCNHPTTGSLVS